jgi:hypothetical protein
MPPRKPRTPAPIVPTLPTVPTTRQPRTPSAPTGSPSSALSALPEQLTVNYPDIQGLLPSDWFKPSSSAVPQTDDATKEEELRIAHEQGNSIELLAANMDNAIALAAVALKATRIGKLAAEYLLGLEEIRAVGVKLRGAQAATQNEERQVLIIQEKGNQLDQRLQGEQIKTQIEGQKNQITRLESDYLNQLHPIKQTEWQNKLQAAQTKAIAALDTTKKQ